ncbi:phage/plasmid primase, P4 family [Gemmatimonadota bacterium]
MTADGLHIDLRTGTFRPADPADLMTLQAPVQWDEDARAPRWEQALVEWFPDEEVRAYVKRVAGSALVGAQRDHVFVIHCGGGRNGKGTFCRALQRTLGSYAAVIHLSLLVEQRYSHHDTVKADLFRARLAVASETQRRVKLDEASVKNLTGGDRVTARRMREDPWEFDPTHSLWLQTNHLPEIGGRDRGIWSRIRVVKWVATFEDKDQDQTLDETLAAEAPGIMRWMVEGCLEWQREGLAEPEQVIRETLAYRQAEDTFSRFADDTGLVFSRNLEIQAGELQELLVEWAQAEGLEPPAKELGCWLRENGVRQARRRFTDPSGNRRQARFWLGVGIEDENHTTAQADVLA